MHLRRLIGCFVLGVSLTAQGDSVPGKDVPRTMAADRPSLAYSVPCLDRSAGDKFLRVDIAEVTNPRFVELAFQVHYQRAESDTVYLGSFALFPPNQPGQFIVPAQGKVESTGWILISMEPLQDKEAAGAVRVVVRSVSFADG